MSEDSEDSRYCDNLPTIIVSPQRYQQHKMVSTPASPTHPSYFPGCAVFSVACGTHSRQRNGSGGSDSENRFPSSPNDMCHTADLRRAALLRSVQMRTQPYEQAEQPFSDGLQQNIRNSQEEEGEEEEDCSCYAEI